MTTNGSIQLADGRYTLHSRLGDGGMAQVYRAWDERLEVWRAIKLLRSELAHHASARQRFDLEARSMARLQHPNILAVHDVGQENGTPYMVMDLAPGGSLADWVAQHGSMGAALACRLAEEVLRGLAHAHAEGIVHRDVKPHNVLIASDGRAVVADFGIARVLDSDTNLTRTGATVGTLTYMAPEQRGSARRVGAEADVYAAAGTLYHLLTGREPLDLYAHRPGALEDVPPDLVAIISSAVQYEPDARPSAMQMVEVIAALRPSMGEAPRIDVTSTPAPQPRAGDDETWTDDLSGVDVSGAFTGEQWPALLAPTVPPDVGVRREAPSGVSWRRFVGSVALVLVAGLALAGTWLWAPSDETPLLNAWEPRHTMDLAVGKFECSGGGQVAWLEDGRIVSGAPGQMESVDAGEAEGVLYDGQANLWRIKPEGAGIRATRGEEQRFFPIDSEGHGDLHLGGDGTRALGYGAAGMEWAEVGAPRAVKLTSMRVLAAQFSGDATQVVAFILDEEGPSVVVIDLEDGARTVVASGRSLLGHGRTHLGVAWLEDGRAAWLQTPDDEPTAVYAVRPWLPDATPVRMLDVAPEVVLMTGSGHSLCFVGAVQRLLIEVVDVDTLQPIHELRVDNATTLVAGWVDNGRIQLFDEGGAYRTWIPETGQVEEGQVWSPEPLPDLDWEPIDLRCASGFCVALDVDIQGRRFTPVDRETGEAGPKWPVALPGSDKGVWDLSSDGRVAMIISGGVQVIAADGATVTPVGVGELGEVMDLKWAPDGGLWIVGMVGGGSTIVHWTSDETQVIRKVDGIAHTPLVAPDGERAAVRIVDVGGMELSLFEGSDAP